jgi:hypothetical protein
MSCFIVSNDQIGYLVNLGYQLDIRGVTLGDTYQSLALYDEHDRRYVTAELIAANRTSVATRYRESVDPVTDVPEVSNPKVSFKNLAQFAQALRWVRCYQYQSCDDPNWTTTFAYHYTQRLTVELVSKIIECFATSWTYDGPKLT